MADDQRFDLLYRQFAQEVAAFLGRKFSQRAQGTTRAVVGTGPRRLRHQLLGMASERIAFAQRGRGWFGQRHGASEKAQDRVGTKSVPQKTDIHHRPYIAVPHFSRDRHKLSGEPLIVPKVRTLPSTAVDLIVARTCLLLQRLGADPVPGLLQWASDLGRALEDRNERVQTR